MHSIWFSSTFLSLSKIHQIKEAGPNFLGVTNLQNSWIIWSPLLYFNFRNLKDPKSWSFIRFQYILLDSAVLLSRFWNFVKLKRLDLISWRKPILQNSWIMWSPLLCFNFRSLRDSISSSFVIFQRILPDSAALFSAFLIFFKLKRGDLISF